MDYRTAFKGKYIKASDLVADVALTISAWSMEEVTDLQGNVEDKLVIAFTERSQRLILNKTNGNTLGNLFGCDTDGWIGKRIVLTVAETDFGGERKPCVRVKSTPAPAAASTAPPAGPTAKTAMRDAMLKLAANYPDHPKEEIRAVWDGAVKAYFNGKPAEVLSASDWQRFVLDGFVRKPIENPIGDEQEFTESDIPF